jgi:hypothetical protein
MLSLVAFIAFGLAAPPPAWEFRDELNRDGRPMATFRTVDLGDAPPRPIHVDDKPSVGAKFGDLRLGQGGASRRMVVWHAATGTLWLDADGDGRFAATERHSLGKDPLEIRTTFPVGDSSVTRTLVVKRRGEGIAYTVRGYMSGTVMLGGKAYAALLTDGDADGCFDSAAADRIWIDLDGDGKFDPLTEQFPLGSALTHAGTAYLLRPNAAGTQVTVRERPSETGTVRVVVSRLAKTEVVEMTAQLVSEWGELVTVPTADKPHPLPAGRYRVEGVHLKLKDEDGQVWTYRFAGTRDLVATIEKSKETRLDVTEGLRVPVELTTAGDRAKPGQAVRVRADVVTGIGLYLTDCDVATRGGGYGRPVRAAIRLAGPGSVAVDEVEAGFL